MHKIQKQHLCCSTFYIVNTKCKYLQGRVAVREKSYLNLKWISLHFKNIDSKYHYFKLQKYVNYQVKNVHRLLIEMKFKYKLNLNLAKIFRLYSKNIINHKNIAVKIIPKFCFIQELIFSSSHLFIFLTGIPNKMSVHYEEEPFICW